MNAVLERKYESLRDTLVEQVKSRISDTELNELKSEYCEVIDSKRTLSYIKDLDGLIKILETRRALGSDCIEPLEHIQERFIDDSKTKDMLIDYKEYSTQFLPLDLCNMYRFTDGKYDTIGSSLDWFLQTNCNSKASYKETKPVRANEARMLLLNRLSTLESKVQDNTSNDNENFKMSLLNKHRENENSHRESMYRNNKTELKPLVENLPNSNHENYTRETRNPSQETFLPKIECSENSVNPNLCNKEANKLQIVVNNYNNEISTWRQAVYICLVITISIVIIIASFVFILANQKSFDVTDSASEVTSTSDQQSTQYQERSGNFQHVTQVPLSTREQAIQREAQLKRNVLRHVSEQLGRSWRDVARNLNIREFEIEAIETKFPTDLKEQGYEALKMSLDISGKRWVVHLQRALEMARRKDLRELVDKLLDDNE